MKYQLTAEYSSSSYWHLDFDLNKVFEWNIKWGILYVKHTEKDEKFLKYVPTYEASDDHEAFKFPLTTVLEEFEEVEDK